MVRMMPSTDRLLEQPSVLPLARCANQNYLHYLVTSYSRIGIIQFIHHYYFTLAWVALRSCSMWIVMVWRFDLTYIEKERLEEFDANMEYWRRTGQKKPASHLAEEFVWRDSWTGTERLVWPKEREGCGEPWSPRARRRRKGKIVRGRLEYLIATLSFISQSNLPKTIGVENYLLRKNNKFYSVSLLK